PMSPCRMIMGVPSPFSIYRHLPSSTKCSFIQRLVGNKRPNIGISCHKEFSNRTLDPQVFFEGPPIGSGPKDRSGDSFGGRSPVLVPNVVNLSTKVVLCGEMWK